MCSSEQILVWKLKDVGLFIITYLDRSGSTSAVTTPLLIASILKVSS